MKIKTHEPLNQPANSPAQLEVMNMKTRQSRRQAAKVSHSRWLAYATASAATALTASPSAEAAIHYSGILNQKFPPNIHTEKRFPLDQPGDFLVFERHEDTVPFFYRSDIDKFDVHGIASADFRVFSGYPYHTAADYYFLFQSCTSARTYPAVLFVVLTIRMHSWRIRPPLDAVMGRGGIAALAASVLSSITVRAHSMDGYGSKCPCRRNTLSKWCPTLTPTPVSR